MTNGCWVFDELFSKLNFILSESPLTVVMFQPPGSGSGVLTSDSSLVTEEARVQAEHMVPTSLRSVIIDVYSKVLWLSVYFLDFVYSSKYFKCSPLSLYSVLFSHIFRC